MQRPEMALLRDDARYETIRQRLLAGAPSIITGSGTVAWAALCLDDAIVVVIRRDAMEWDITRHGRAWGGSEAWERFNRTPEKFEMCGGRLFWSDEDHP